MLSQRLLCTFQTIHNDNMHIILVCEHHFTLGHRTNISRSGQIERKQNPFDLSTANILLQLSHKSIAIQPQKCRLGMIQENKSSFCISANAVGPPNESSRKWSDIKAATKRRTYLICLIKIANRLLHLFDMFDKHIEQVIVVAYAQCQCL